MADKKTDDGFITREEAQKMSQDAAASAAKAAVEALMPAIAAVSLQRPAHPTQGIGPAQRVPVIRCNVCGQDQRACAQRDPKTGQYVLDATKHYIPEHVSMVVFPNRYPEFSKWFMGVTINGVRYLSNNGSHQVTVPAACVSGILSHIQVWEDNERELRIGKKVTHESGDVGNPKREIQYFR